MKRLALVILAALAVLTVPLLAATWINTPFNFDSNGNLRLAAVAIGGGQGTTKILSNAPVNLDSNGNPKVVLEAGSTISVPSLGTTSTDGLVVTNTTASTVGTTVQISPRIKMCGTAWNSSGAASETDCMFIETLPVTVAGTTTAILKFGYINNAGTVTYPMTLSSGGDLTSTSGVVGGSNLQIFGKLQIRASADKLWQINDTANATGLELNAGSATLGTCTGGTITTGSHNQAGGYTGNTSGSCVINFGTPNWTNAPFCMAASIASTTHPRISAVSTSSMTITGGVSGEAITYVCFGRIGV